MSRDDTTATVVAEMSRITVQLGGLLGEALAGLENPDMGGYERTKLAEDLRARLDVLLAPEPTGGAV